MLCTLVAWRVPFSWCCPACPCAPYGGFTSKSHVFPGTPPSFPGFPPLLCSESTPTWNWLFASQAHRWAAEIWKKEWKLKKKKTCWESVNAAGRMTHASFPLPVVPLADCVRYSVFLLCSDGLFSRSRPRPRASTQHRSRLRRRSALFYWMQ